MKRLVVLTALSLGLAIGTTACAHQHLHDSSTRSSGSHAKEALIGAAVFAGVVAAAMLLPCNECKDTDFGVSAQRPALPPR